MEDTALNYNIAEELASPYKANFAQLLTSMQEILEEKMNGGVPNIQGVAPMPQTNTQENVQ